MKHDASECERRRAPGTKQGTIWGTGVGMICGAAFGNPGIGLVLGAGIGLIVGASIRSRKD